MKQTILISSLIFILSTTIPMVTYYFMVQHGNNYGLSSILPGFFDLFTDLNRDEAISDYLSHHSESSSTKDYNHDLAAESYFVLATEFFEWGWGDAIHMAPMKKEWGFKQSMDFWELWFIKHLNITSSSIVVDSGCGIGGPLRRIAEYTGAQMIGVTNCKHQIERAYSITNNPKLTSNYVKQRVKYIHADYNNITTENIANNSVDVVYFMESLSHSHNRALPLKEAYRILKPNGIVGAWQWMLKDGFNYSDSYHMSLKTGMEYGGGLSNLNKPNERLQEFADAGFMQNDIIDSYDMGDISNEMGWYPFWKSLNEGHDIPSMFTSSYFGRYLTMCIVYIAESLGIAEAGTYNVAVLLESCADCAVRSGQIDVFTPLWLTVAKKPN